MSGWQTVHRTRELPVFFLADVSDSMRGTFEVTLQTGLLSLGDRLERRTSAVIVKVIPCNENSILYAIPPLESQPLNLQAQGQCKLKPALETLSHALDFNAVANISEGPDCYSPLVFIILGSKPVDRWHCALGPLIRLRRNRRPIFIVLLLHDRQDLVKEMLPLSYRVLALSMAEAEYVTHFFSWATSTIIAVLEELDQGNPVDTFLPLPTGILVKG